MISHHSHHEGRLIDNTADLHEIVNPALHHSSDPSLLIEPASSPPHTKTYTSRKKQR